MKKILRRTLSVVCLVLVFVHIITGIGLIIYVILTGNPAHERVLFKMLVVGVLIMVSSMFWVILGQTFLEEGVDEKAKIIKGEVNE